MALHCFAGCTVGGSRSGRATSCSGGVRWVRAPLAQLYSASSFLGRLITWHGGWERWTSRVGSTAVVWTCLTDCACFISFGLSCCVVHTKDLLSPYSSSVQRHTFKKKCQSAKLLPDSKNWWFGAGIRVGVPCWKFLAERFRVSLVCISVSLSPVWGCCSVAGTPIYLSISKSLLLLSAALGFLPTCYGKGH